MLDLFLVSDLVCCAFRGGFAMVSDSVYWGFRMALCGFRVVLCSFNMGLCGCRMGLCIFGMGLLWFQSWFVHF